MRCYARLPPEHSSIPTVTFDDRVVDICVGQAVFLVLREGDLDSDRLDENDLGIALVKSITGAPKQGVKLATSLDDLDDRASP